MRRPPPLSTLFPYTTLFRSLPHRRINKCSCLERLNVLGTVAHGATHLHEAGALPLVPPCPHGERRDKGQGDRKSTRLNSSHPSISYAVFCLKKKIDTLYVLV